MAHILIITCILLFPSICQGADWEEVGFDGMYVDVSSIKEVAPNQYKACFKAELKKDILLREAERYSFFDCTGRKSKALITIKYLRNGDIIETGEEGLEDVPPDSIMENILLFVCNYKNDVHNVPGKENKQ